MKKRLLLFALVCWAGMQMVNAQTRSVKGQVLDEKGEAMPGASVKVKGGKGGTTTDVDGNFTLEVPDGNDELIINAIGYSAQEIKAGDGNTTLHAKLATEGKVIGETVVTALNIKREKKALGYSVSEVSAEDIEKSGERNAIEALAAKAPGVQVTSSSGTPGASVKIRLRGNATFTGTNDPLMVVDGIPIDNSTNTVVGADVSSNPNLAGVNESNRGLDINPDDIESVTVLKGPAAASLYGARGGNGAIIITTKKGQYGKGQGLGISVNSSVEINKVSKLPKMQNSYGQGKAGEYITGNTPLSWGPKLDTTDLPVYDNFSNFFKTGLGFNNSIGITAGGENSTMRVGFGNYNTTGIVPNSNLKRTTVDLSAESKLSKWLTIGGSAQYSYTQGRRVQNGSNVAGTMLSLFRMPVTYDIRNYYDPVLHKSLNYNSAYDNPLFTAYRNPYTDFTNRILGNIYFNATITKDLSLSYKIGTDAYSSQGRQIYDLGSKGNNAQDGTGQMNRTTLNYMQVYSDAILKYNKRVSDFTINSFIGYNYWYQERKSNFLRGSQQTVPDKYNLKEYKDLYASNQDEYVRTQAFFGEINIGYKSFLYATLTGREEWSTTFGKTSSGFFYPKGDISWIFSEHLSKNNFLSFGKLRVAASKVGIPPLPYKDKNYYKQPILSDGYTNGNSFPYEKELGFAPPIENHPGGLKPETNVGSEIGLELKFWQNRLSFEGSYYNQVSHDLLLSKPVGPSSGYQYEYKNAGSMRNRGVELALNAEVFKTKDWDVNVGINWSKNVNKVLALDDNLSEVSIEPGFESIGSYAIVGQPYGVFYGTGWKRNDQGKILVNEKGLPVGGTLYGRSTSYVEVNPIEGLVLRSQVGLQYADYKRQSFLQPGSLLDILLNGVPTGSKTDNGSTKFNFVWTNTAEYKKTLNEVHNFKFLIGTEYTNQDSSSYGLNSTGYPSNPSLYTQNNGGKPRTTSTAFQSWSLMSYFARAEYNYKGKYSLNASIRRDGSSVFGDNVRYGDFGAVGVAWNVTEESFIHKNSTLNFLKIWGTVGTSGNNNIGPYDHLALYNYSGYANAAAQYPNNTSSGNENLTWEKNTNTSIGADFVMFKNRLTGNIDYYFRHTHSLILDKPISSTTGYDTKLSNLGSMNNSGVEIQLNYDVVKTKDLLLSVGGDVTFNKNKVTALKDAQPIRDNGAIGAGFKIGQPYDVYYMKKYAGIDVTNGDELWYTQDGAKTNDYAAAGSFYLDGKSSQPTYFGGFYTNIKYKGIGLSVDFYYSGGAYTNNATWQNLNDPSLVSNSNLSQDAANYWSPTNTNAPNPLPGVNRPTYDSDRWLQKTDYIRLRNLLLSYEFSSAILNKIKMKGLRFYVQGSNLWYSAPHFKGDPEVGAGGKERGYVHSGNLALSAYPQTKAVTCGLNITF